MNNELDLCDYGIRLNKLLKLEENMKIVPNNFMFRPISKMTWDISPHDFGWVKYFNCFEKYNCKVELKFNNGVFEYIDTYISLNIILELLYKYREFKENVINYLETAILLEKVPQKIVTYENVDMDLVRKWCSIINDDYIISIVNKII